MADRQRLVQLIAVAGDRRTTLRARSGVEVEVTGPQWLLALGIATVVGLALTAALGFWILVG